MRAGLGDEDDPRREDVMGRETPVDKYNLAKRLSNGLAVVYREEEPRVGHPERGVRGTTPDACPNRSKYIDELWARLNSVKREEPDAALLSDEKLVG